MKIIAIRRDARFSPNCSEKDRAILEAASREICKHFKDMGNSCELRWINERDLKASDKAEIYLSMARLPEALQLLEEFERQGRRVVNCPRGVWNCRRSSLEKIMRSDKIPMPAPIAKESAPNGSQKYWLKRGDGAAQEKEDVLFCENHAVLEAAKKFFKERGITDYVVSQHVVGDIVKFYGVGDHFFRYFYPTDDGETKFGHERINGPAHHYNFDENQLRKDINRLAQLVGLKIYGGDIIVRPDGSYCFIDFNDWPSFSRCRDEAAEAIAEIINN